MPSEKKLFVTVISSDFRISGPPIEIKDEPEAVQQTLQMRGVCFNTFEMESVTLNGKELWGEPENHSKRRYVGIDKIYSRDEVIASMQAEVKNAFDDLMADAIKSVINFYNKMPADSVHITGLERPGEFIQIKSGEKVFNSAGKQIWPPVTPAPARVNKPSI